MIEYNKINLISKIKIKKKHMEKSLKKKAVKKKPRVNRKLNPKAEKTVKTILKFIVLFLIVFAVKDHFSRSLTKYATADSFPPDHIELPTTVSPPPEAGESRLIEIEVYHDSGYPDMDVYELSNAIFTISPSIPDAYCTDKNGDYVPFGTPMEIDLYEGLGDCYLKINTPGIYEIDLEGVEDQYSSIVSTFSDADYDMEVEILEATMDYLEVTGESETQVAGTYQKLTVTGKSVGGLVVDGYSGDKDVVFSGPSASLQGDEPTCLDKDDNPIQYGDLTTLTFVDGIATCKTHLYKAETASIDVEEGIYDSFNSSDYDFDVEVIKPEVRVEKDLDDEVCVFAAMKDEAGDPYTDEIFDVGFKLTSDSANYGEAFSSVIREGAVYSACYIASEAGEDKIITVIGGDDDNIIKGVENNEDFVKIDVEEEEEEEEAIVPVTEGEPPYIEGKFKIDGKAYTDKDVELRNCVTREILHITTTDEDGEFTIDDEIEFGKKYCVEASQKKRISKEKYFSRMELYKQKYAPTFGEKWFEKKFYDKYREKKAKDGIRYYKKYRGREEIRIEQYGEIELDLELKAKRVN